MGRISDLSGVNGIISNNKTIKKSCEWSEIVIVVKLNNKKINKDDWKDVLVNLFEKNC